MLLRILTLGRPTQQTTFKNLPLKYQRMTEFVIQEGDWHKNASQYEQYLGDAALHILPPEIKNLHQTRQYLLDLNRRLDRVEVQMDDDLVFSARRLDDPSRFRPMLDQDYNNMFAEIEQAAYSFPLAGLSHREGANRNPQERLFATRQMRVHAFVPKGLHKLGRWDVLRSPGPEDFAMILQVLTKGYENCVLNDWVHNQGGSNTEGGCSTYRTPAVHSDACHHLAELFPEFVKVVQKETKGSWGGGTRTDVRIQWKKAYEYGCKRNAGLLDR